MNAINYRRKDYILPRSMREAFGSDDTFEPEIRCVSELWGLNQRRSAWPVFLGCVFFVIGVIQVVKVYGH